MPRVYQVKKARKARPEHGIEVGDSYYYWKLRFGQSFSASRMCYSKTYPKPWQLTTSDYLQQLYQLADRVANLTASETLEDEARDIVGEVENLGSEQQEKLDNMPEQLQYAPSGELLQERVTAMETWAQELEQAIGSIQSRDDFESDEEYEDHLQAALDELQSVDPEIN